MKALVLAAGEGTRLRPLTSNIPKPLLPVAGKPFLSHIFSALQSAGVKEIALLVGWKANRIKEYYGDGSSLGLKITYLEQRERMGTANAIGHAEWVMDEPFFVVNGDVVISEANIKAMREMFERTGRTVMGAVTVEDPSKFGVIEEKDGKLVRILEKPKRPPSDLINAGLFVFTPGIFDLIRSTPKSIRGEYEITDTITTLAKSEDVLIHRMMTEWIDVGRPWDLLTANDIFMSRLQGRLEGEVEPNVVIKGEVVLEEGAKVRSGSYITGPVYIAKGCDIGPNSYIRPGCCFMPNVRVGASVEVKNSIVMNGAMIGHLSYCGDSIVGEKVNLGAGTITANFRHDGRTHRSHVDGRLVETGRTKFGAVIGDGVHTGIHTSIYPGRKLWPGVCTRPGTIVAYDVMR
jgi:UDP-N-acetylglucosamine diphosphorylase / glucose-1-phosphate thymidylyltransferase / UDP-N-acetylgalactosamine diphosphorylase / glucosamine-1-phosphate N-acetyltransferase / galactosamine-1-phosphate N-acetyltransferase